ncbi:hypothetical protein J7E38_22745 [Bacillus sp. ISL-35]|uniref:hypothetical protein n=1 Tax=Bacillus sp. ISL-35 TaxID=2819122 RepID=UPI001BE6CE4F|nr:hypothetical protein [Bacillus sp. ISL-35]MBT2681781.1 hypothetical protein [Bacillus sp. ISL-35]MBT2706078.1 hypothetical protein [Chryseobacterium sp. ISL-80]
MKRKNHIGDISDLFCDRNVSRVPLPRLEIIPVSEVPDDCVLVRVGPVYFLACYGTGEEPFDDCEIVCTESGFCYLVCPVTPEEE